MEAAGVAYGAAWYFKVNQIGKDVRSGKLTDLEGRLLAIGAMTPIPHTWVYFAYRQLLEQLGLEPDNAEAAELWSSWVLYGEKRVSED